MKASELIAALKAEMQEAGDREVRFSASDGSSDSAPLEKVVRIQTPKAYAILSVEPTEKPKPKARKKA